MFSNNNQNKNSVFLKNFQTRLSQFFNQSESTKTETNTISNKAEKVFMNSETFEKTNLKKTNSQLNSLKNNNKGINNRTTRGNDNAKQQVVSITYEEIGLFPRSFNRVFDRFFKQLFFDVENLVIQEYRFYRYLFLTTIKCVFILLFVPLTVNFLSKNYLVRPITEYYWNTHQPEIFLNSYQQKRAFTELQEFEEKIYFESLVLSNGNQTKNLNSPQTEQTLKHKTSLQETKKNKSLGSSSSKSEFSSNNEIRANQQSPIPISNSILVLQNSYGSEFFSESVQNRLHEKILELALHYNEESIEAITNFFADLISFVTLCYLFFALEIQINITKSFLLEVFFGLDDSKKSLFILFITDLLVGYHSPNIWELFFSSFFDHYGLPESETTIFLLVATLPVLLDVLFKYLIFRHLNRASPATVATYHAMIE